ncbi:MAG: pyruvate ferredoxin oxidoreductase subunit gamma [Xanthomonadaceae bacterium]|nr:pyruvate ferredoxin oxidoreductase subunit gamma [Rhodospirillaceae bacterium]NIA17808.1 pyruvate ferredoxin oxidoreductase subunit gamma [Xanthomonadaceae bacterium]
MIEIRIHGRGGQGVVTAAELIAIAAFYEGKESQAFPNFGVERRGAPIESYARISDQPIKLRSQIYEPDFIIVQDDTLFSIIDLFKGIKKDTKIIINTNKKLSLKLDAKKENILFIPATKIALEVLGKPIINTVMLGAFAKFSELIKLTSIEKALKSKFSGEILEKNIKAAKQGSIFGHPKVES